jgi:hypothetical protein
MMATRYVIRVRDLLLAMLQRAFHAPCAGPCLGRPAPDGVDLDRHHLRAGDGTDKIFPNEFVIY